MWVLDILVLFIVLAWLSGLHPRVSDGLVIVITILLMLFMMFLLAIG
jgi:hypothetical protein